MTYQIVKFSKPPNTLAELSFIIKNNTDDTVYISNRNVKIEVRKQGVLLTNHSPSQAFPPLATQADQKKDKHEITTQKRLNNLKLQFARKLIEKNFANKKKPFDSAWLTEQIVDNCLIIFPQQSIPYQQYFWNKSLDKNSTISGCVEDSKVFLEFNDMNNQLQRLYYH